MTNRKATKRALLMSFLSILLCASMLIGTTYAWFTDSVTSAGNIIKSGTLDVEMYWADGTKAVPADDSADWKDASKGAIFNYDKWEPGYTEVRHIKIANEGTLALKYHLNIAANGEVSDLADVIDVYYADPAVQVADRTALTNEIGTLSDVLDGMPANMAGELEAGKSVTVTIALKMQEEAGNEYQDQAIGADFKVVLMATQDNVEFDSFDENYDDIEIPDKHIKEIDGNTYYFLDNGEVVLRSVPYGNVGTTFTVPDFVTIIGIAKDKGDTNGPVFSKYSSVESITLPEGVKEVNARAINMQTLKAINFPSTLEYIGEQAFRMTGMSELTIPATVKMIDEGAFRDMANLTTVTIEGNPTLANYVFRSCPKLETIYLLGDDVKFEGGGQFATHQDTGYSNPLTIYVKNSEVAARVIAAQSSASDYEVKILGAAADGSDATDVAQAKNQNELKTALASGAATVILKENVNYGTVTIGDLKNATIKGGEGTVAILKTDANTKIENVTVDGVAFEYTGATVDCGVVIDPNAQIKNLVLDGCTFTGTGAKAGRGISGLNNTASLVLKDCTFKDLGYPIYAWGGYESLTIEGCTFDNIKSWAIMPQSGFNGDLTVTGCTFKNCLGGGLIKAGTLTAGHTFTFTNNIVEGCTVAGDHNWFQFNASAGTTVISGNTKDGAAWTPTAADGLK